MTDNKRANLVFLLLLVAYLVYAGFYIERTSWVVGGERYFILNDDAMISMRYARNLANGDGLVWNPGGERVEGFTNPLWVVTMAFWHLFPIPARLMSLPIQLTGLIFLALNLMFVRRIAFRLSGSHQVTLLAVALTAFYGPLNNWGLLGMEVSALVLLVSMAAWSAIQAFDSGRFLWRPYLLLGLGTLVRFDMAVPYLAVWLAFMLWDPANRRRHLTHGLGLLALLLAGQTGLRLAYYGAWLPNTYTLKMTGLPTWVRVGNGLAVFLKLIERTGWPLVVLPLAVLLYRRDCASLLLAGLLAAQAAYSIYVGGDAWEHKGGANRYISLAMPGFFILFTQAAADLWRFIGERAAQFRWPPARALANLGLAVFVLAAMVQFNAVEDLRSLRKWILTARPEFTVGNEEYVRIALALNKITTPDATLAVVTAGAIPYFTDRPCIDLLGKNDPVIAALDAHLPAGLWAKLTGFRPGHAKWDYAYSIGKLQPDVVVQLWDEADVARALMAADYAILEIDGLTFSVRRDSPHILWDAADAIIQP
ncbi:MAG: hypothetical protein HYZ26_13350 [Chloroflexi bacterium]|nr:hypothetical protein [Chloroflexota bacterium]